MGMNRVNELCDMKEDVKRAAGHRAAKPYQDAYARVVDADRKPISDAEIDCLLVQGGLLLKEMSES